MMMNDRLAEIIGNGAAVFDLLDHTARQALVDRCGSIRAARLAAWDELGEAQRIALVKAAGAVPEACGDDIPTAPARGGVRAFDYFAAYPSGETEAVVKPAGFMGRKTMARADAFDRMLVQGARRAGAVPILTASQVGMGRMYGAMVQDHLAGAVRCISVEAMKAGGGGTAEGFTDHRLDLSRRIDRLRHAVGGGSAMAVRRVRPSARGDKGARRNIPDMALVDLVCIEDADLSDVLRRYGWSVYGDTVRAVGQALAGALERMIGPAIRHRSTVWHAGVQETP